MAMPKQTNLNISGFKQVDHFVPIRERFVERIMIDKNDWLIRVFHIRQNRVEEYHLFARNQSGSHAHIRATCRSDEKKSILFERITFGTKDPYKIVVTAFRPFGIVISGSNVTRLDKFADNGFGFEEFFFGAKFSNIS